MSGRFSKSGVLTAAVILSIAVATFVSVVSAIDPAGDYPSWPQGPGLTLDESFNVQQGVYLARAIEGYGLGLLHFDSIREVFGDPFYLPDHPPLGRIALGAAHHATRAMFPTPLNDTPYVVAAARTGSAVAFALLVLLVGWTAYRWYGSAGGIVAAISLVLMPRVYGHAHLAALETFMSLTYAAAVVSLAAYWTHTRRPRLGYAALAGMFFGLALLTKIQAILLPVPVVLWALGYWRHRSILSLLVWGLVGLAVFFACWPWLWLDPIEHVVSYFAQTTERDTIQVWYFDTRFDDVAVPWHYPFVLFLVSVPIGVQLLGLVGLLARRRGDWLDRRDMLVVMCAFFPLVVFALPGVAVYDGARLFLVSFPLWALLIGRGASKLLAWLTHRRGWSPIVSGATLAIIIGTQAYGVFAVYPSYLSYYNVLVGGLPGAERLGLEVTYWGDSVTRGFLRDVTEAVPPGSRIETFPILHPFQLEGLMRQSPVLREHRIQLRPYQGFEEMRGPYLMVFRRRADLPEPIRDVPPRSRLLAEVTRQGVQLAALYEIAPESDEDRSE